MDIVEMFDTWHGQWVLCPSMPTCRAGSAAASLPSGEILVVGGYDAKGIADGLLNSCDIFNPQTEVWRPAAPLRRARWGHGCAEIDGKVMVVGGCSTRPLAPSAPMETLRSCEVYDPATDTWTEGQPLLVPRSGARMVSLPRGRVAVVGGCDDVFGHAITQASVEIFDASTGVWELLSRPLLEARTSSAVAALGDNIFVAGGAPSRATAEIFPLAEGVESKALKLSTGRMGCQGAILALPADGSFASDQRNSCFVVVGGEQLEESEDLQGPSRIQQLASVTVFDLETGRWREDSVVPALGDARTTSAVCVAPGRVATARQRHFI